MTENKPTIATIEALFVTTPPDPINYSSKIKEIEDKIAAFDEFVSETDFYGFEYEENDVDQVRLKLVRRQKAFEMAQNGYFQELDYSRIPWISAENGLPNFVVFDADSNEFSMTAQAYSNDEDSISIYPTLLPETVSQLLDPAFDKLHDLSKKFGKEEDGKSGIPQLPNDGSVTAAFVECFNILLKKLVDIVEEKTKDDQEFAEVFIKTTYHGFLSRESRNKIEEARESSQFDSFYIIAEAPLWVTNQPVPISGQILIIGWIKDTEQMFVIESAFPSKLEDLIE